MNDTNFQYCATDTCLNGLWDFSFIGQVEPQIALHTAVEMAEWDKAIVPSAFDASVNSPGVRGMALYRRYCHIPAGRQAELWFGALSMWSRVYVDGQLLKENACGYEPLRIHVPAASSKKRELIVMVDNRFNFELVPMHEAYFDFYQYGGILRDVRMRLLPENGPWIRAVRVTPTEAYDEGEITIDVDLEDAWKDQAFSMAITTDGARYPVSECDFRDTENGRQLTMRVPQPRLWSPDKPHLHTLQVSLWKHGEYLQDRRQIRFGLRRFEAFNGQLWLNGEPIMLKGYNRHEWHPSFGPCTPVAQMFSDIQILKDMGCNFVRGSHYHQDQCFLDLCDELGLLVWEENLGWGQREKTFTSRKFVDDHRRALISMVRESYNHPSVVCWGLLNEAGSDSGYACSVFEESISLLRHLDPSRLVTFASMYPYTDKYFGLVDFISINAYPGWYGCENAEAPLEMIEPELEKIAKSIDGQGFAQKPIVISEIGAEGLYGWRDVHDDFFTESYQSQYLKTAIEKVLGNPRFSGILLWHFSDVRTYSGGRSLMRPRTFNNKGTLDEYRRPKDAYAVVKDAFRCSQLATVNGDSSHEFDTCLISVQSAVSEESR